MTFESAYSSILIHYEYHGLTPPTPYPSLSLSPPTLYQPPSTHPLFHPHAYYDDSDDGRGVWHFLWCWFNLHY